MADGFALAEFVEVRLDVGGRDGEVLVKKAGEIESRRGGTVVLQSQEFDAVAGGEDEAFAYAGLVEEGAGSVGQALDGYGEALADLDGRGVVVDGQGRGVARLFHSWRSEPVDGRELVRSPDGEDDQEDKAGEVDGAASAQAGVATDEDHADVGEPHGEGEKDLWIEEVAGTDGLLGDERADEQADGHAGKAEEERLECDLVGGVERGEPGDGGCLLLEAAFLDQVEKGGQQADEEGCIGGEYQDYVEDDDPAGVEGGEPTPVRGGRQRGRRAGSRWGGRRFPERRCGSARR